ncbi:hypothetical protein NEISICOT_03043 [Neisseria sicca ATCC 29256]|uniref:Uncharacterized protein n=1 Tax=Neisseria sicca ATCC 29256 TaxID=547045 RepID=C6M918_NEISI|nr:hypothetical protein NEISICOT_03043 [Neisseria sicca ATCC 29256]
MFYCFATQTKGRLKTRQALAVFRRPFYPPSFLFETQPNLNHLRFTHSPTV